MKKTKKVAILFRIPASLEADMRIVVAERERGNRTAYLENLIRADMQAALHERIEAALIEAQMKKAGVK